MYDCPYTAKRLPGLMLAFFMYGRPASGNVTKMSRSASASEMFAEYVPSGIMFSGLRWQAGARAQRSCLYAPPVSRRFLHRCADTAENGAGSRDYSCPTTRDTLSSARWLNVSQEVTLRGNRWLCRLPQRETIWLLRHQKKLTHVNESHGGYSAEFWVPCARWSSGSTRIRPTKARSHR